MDSLAELDKTARAAEGSTIEDDGMTDNQDSHITVTYRDDDAEITCIYAISEDTLRDAQAWSSHQTNATGKDLQAWLERKKCQLDSSGGPAYVRRNADGSRVETYCRDGRWHREDGPAFVRRFGDGSTEEEYYREGRLHREDGPAAIHHFADGSMVEKYFCHGKLHREDGPALVGRTADGAMEKEYYREGNFVKREKFAPLAAIPGVRVQRPTPKALDTPSGPGPA